MTIKNENPIDSFVENSKKNRKIKISEDDIKKINDLLEDANNEETFEDRELPLVAKSKETSVGPQLRN